MRVVILEGKVNQSLFFCQQWIILSKKLVLELAHKKIPKQSNQTGEQVAGCAPPGTSSTILTIALVCTLVPLFIILIVVAIVLRILRNRIPALDACWTAECGRAGGGGGGGLGKGSRHHHHHHHHTSHHHHYGGGGSGASSGFAR
ncbi:hypothetical protein FDP41_012107 [Naegleria fowleri]|uniref:Uncharacterized protein n=1 Tax=Naegleria fowleri TaxID=5763 RepID=A0A6A5C6M9_NAEFO|nr:uncharacterized protein FDP41_012107 [Naegleria fowleri]KAF0981450.1 hypothetical protein FDP41_012107 [Naegleria fowleri]